MTTVVRQSDIKFSGILTKIGDGEELNAEETEVIQSRFRKREWCETNLPSDVVRLFFDNEHVKAYNTKTIKTTDETEEVIATDTYIGYSTEAERKEAVGKVHRMKNKDTGNLAYCIKFTKKYPYMLTTNVDVEDGLVNGAIGILRHIEHRTLAKNESGSRLIWLEFENHHIGRLRRIKYRAHIRTNKHDLKEEWVPIELRTVNINVTPKIKCRRYQFPLLPACALTIHKSQGSTFEKIVYDYHKNHKQQLVYVALSRVTCLQGLFLTNERDDFTFHHAEGSASPSIKSVRNEITRLATHRLPTLTGEIRESLDACHANEGWYVIANVNVQSLRAHAEDITSDELLSRADFLLLTETWLNNTSSPVDMEGFRLEHQSPCNERSGGVAIYKRCGSPISAKPIPGGTGNYNQEFSSNDLAHATDVAIIEVTTTKKPFILASIYMHQHAEYKTIEASIMNFLDAYSVDCGDTEIPLIIMGDFNTTERNRPKLEKFLAEKFRLKLDSDVTQRTTLAGTCIDLTFSRHLTVTCKSYVSYFSFHCPVFNMIITD